jgi:hypothetical protein
MPLNSEQADPDRSNRMQAQREIRRHGFQERSRARSLALYASERTSKVDDKDNVLVKDVPVIKGEQAERISLCTEKSHHPSETLPQVSDAAHNFSDASDENIDAAALQSAGDDCTKHADSSYDFFGDGGADEDLNIHQELSSCEGSPSPDDKHDEVRFAVSTDSDQNDRAIEIPLFSTARPHMRAFHVSL